ncbi:MAG: acetyl-CoA carboxylase, biotin carboxyl carrier protein [Acidobacteria bacterium RIFCSPLOWO2_12_FULL_54_10]|nr:MAG: acetyl-CoA carboxylase, biotin carboxyl carrier protein [Acidobacteria bacterium RIFCSPLOWO2_12_FULL_54_10]
MVDLEQVKELIDLLTEKGISDFEMERAGMRLRISRGAASTPFSYVAVQPGESARTETATLSSALAIESHARPAASAEPASPSSEKLHAIRSPMVGTFYSSPVQGAPAFVQPGSKVQPGQIICIVEAMKLMNEIESDVAGEIVNCLVENWQPVEYGEVLFELRLSSSSAKRS